MSLSKEEIVDRFLKNDLVLASHSLDRILEKDIDVDKVIQTAKEENIWLVTDELLERFITQEKELSTAAEQIAQPEKVEVLRTNHIFAKEVESRLHIHTDSDVTGKSTCEGSLDDFVNYFNTKYKILSDILRKRPNLADVLPIDRIKKSPSTERAKVKIICAISGKRESRRGYKFLDVEDPTGEISILLPSGNQSLVAMYDQLLLDEVIGVEGILQNDLIIAEDITQPDLPIARAPNTTDEPVYLALLSDLHVGSYLFLEKEFDRFLNWINGHGESQDIAEKIKYVLIAGDSVDGIGIYPKQEKELVIPDIYKQYSFLALLLERIPDHIEIVLSMGNHDAVRNAEPQPRLDKDIGGPLYELPNVHVVGNPIMVSTHGVKTLMYHGTTMDTMIGNLVDCTYTSPEKAMIEYLKRRHLAPMYGNDGIVPEDKDYMAITEIPDIFHCGHVHTNGYAIYRGVKVINSGTWQGKTKYQERLGHLPTPARLPVVNLQNNEVSIINFSN